MRKCRKCESNDDINTCILCEDYSMFTEGIYVGKITLYGLFVKRKSGSLFCLGIEITKTHIGFGLGLWFVRIRIRR